jgi:toxin ParE1/3/4
MYQLTFSPQSELDLLDIGDYIAQDSKNAARNWVAKLRAQCQKITLNPYGYVARPELKQGIRSAAIGRYIILFSITETTVRIQRVSHGARDLGSIFFE